MCVGVWVCMCYEYVFILVLPEVDWVFSSVSLYLNFGDRASSFETWSSSTGVGWLPMSFRDLFVYPPKPTLEQQRHNATPRLYGCLGPELMLYQYFID